MLAHRTTPTRDAEGVRPGTEGIIVLHSGFTALDDYFLDAVRRRGIDGDVSLRPVRWKPVRALRRVHLLSALPGKAIWFGRWLRNGQEKRMIIVYAANLTLPAAQYAARRFPRARIVFWYWNPAGRGTNPERSQGIGLEAWSFDTDDCARFGMRYNTQFALSEITPFGDAVTPDVDLGFYGLDKGRAPLLSALAQSAGMLGLSYRFMVVPKAGSTLSCYPLLTPAAPIPYVALLKETARARVMVDVAQAGQNGMTLRTVECLFLRRKLVTTIRSVRQSPMYDPTRVFILGEDKLDDLPAFVHAEPNAPSQELLDYYDLEGWLHRFEDVAVLP